jgi:hypothetical protein
VKSKQSQFVKSSSLSSGSVVSKVQEFVSVWIFLETGVVSRYVYGIQNLQILNSISMSVVVSYRRLRLFGGR